jgi:hypothetical protein
VITQIHIPDYQTWIPTIDCDTYPEPFLSFSDVYIIFKDKNPRQIKETDLEIQLKMNDINLDTDDGTMFIQLFNLEKIYAYMLKKQLSKYDKANN